MDLMKLNKEIGARINTLRRARKMTQGDLGEVLGVSYQNVGLKERGEGGLSIDQLITIADLFQVTPQWLIFGEEKSEDSLTVEEQQILELYRQSSDRGKKDMLLIGVGAQKTAHHEHTELPQVKLKNNEKTGG